MSVIREPVVKTKSGILRGNFNDGIYSFKGVPYASPPAGNLRWLPPQPVMQWEGERQAKEFGPIPVQNEVIGNNIAALRISELQSEDCLYLNIWTPDLDDAGRPVMIWIHGGAFTMGSGSQSMFPGQNMAKSGDVVFVSINYRLGALGFLNLNEITNGRIPSTGCEGLLDQLAAIAWVRENIIAFGGDPESITVFGQSAGAMSIACIMSMSESRGLFGKAILQSGGGNVVATLDEAVDISGQYIKLLNLNPHDTEILQTMHPDRLMLAQMKLGASVRLKDGRVMPFHPVVDGKVLPDIPIKAIQKGCASGVKAITGSNSDEFNLFAIMDPRIRKIDEKGLIAGMEKLLPSGNIWDIIRAYKDARFARGQSIEPPDILNAVKTDLMFRMPVLDLVKAQGDNGQPSYNYLFSWKSPAMDGSLEACHSLEIGFIFGNHDESFCGTGPDADALSRKMRDAWFSFAHTGDPSCGSIGKWPSYGNERNVMIFDKECRIENDPYGEERKIWEKHEIIFTKPI